MKKYFIFAAVAAAGLFASCSSSDDIASEAPVNPIENQDDNVAIKIGVAKPTATITRGTGTVGGVVDDVTAETPNAVNNQGTTTNPTTNRWAGQKVNVYMFEHGTLTPAKFSSTDTKGIYENAELTTPYTAANNGTGVAEYLVPDDATNLPAADDPTTQNGVNTPQQERYVKYYPLSGQFDFWGYRIDDATATPAEPAAANDVLSTVITVNGTQDVLAGVTVAPAYTTLSDEQKAVVGDATAYETYKTNKLYSASAARNGIDPTLQFGHMMTRLTFQAYKGSAEAGAYEGENEATPTVFNEATGTYNGVYVTGISVRPVKTVAAAATTTTEATELTYYDRTKGTFNIAGTTDGFKPAITWAVATEKPDSFALMQRPKYIMTTPGTAVDYLDIEATKALTVAEEQAAATTQAGKIAKTYISDYTYTNILSDAGKGKYTQIHADTLDNVKLIDLIAAGVDDINLNGAVKLADTKTDGTVRKNIGESIITPDAEAYEIEIALAQKVVSTESDNSTNVPGTPIRHETLKFSTVKYIVAANSLESANRTTDGKFKVGYSYNFNIKVYGLERIDITTELKPWSFGQDVSIDTDE